jgi:WD40 repeat protein
MDNIIKRDQQREQIKLAPSMNSTLPTLPSVPFVFLSYARADLALVDRLKDDLQAHGIRGWREEREYLSGSPQEEDLRVTMRNTSAVVLIVSPQTRGSRSVKEEMILAQMYQRPIHLFWMDGDRLADVILNGWKDLPTFDARAQRYPPALQDLMRALGQPSPFSSQDLLLDGKTAPLATPRNPYKGLRAFQRDDAGDFFGRDRAISELVEHVRQQLTATMSDENEAHLLTVLGASGSGKSSLVMAGLVPQLRRGVLPGSQYWVYLDVIVPGTHPLEALVLALTPLFPQLSPGSILNDLQDDAARGLHLLLASYVKESDQRVLLVIDQFEELFTQTASEEERQRFLDLLLTAITEPHGPLFLLLTMRADFYDRLLLYPQFGRIVMKHQVPIYPMDVQELRAVIEQPARLPDVQMTFEGDLVGDLLFDIRGQMAALPLLQFTLESLFQRREGRMLTLQTYREMDGVKGALAQHAERIYQSLPTESHQQIAQALFTRLINAGTLEADATKRRVPLSAFTLIDSAKTEVLAKVRELFTHERLLTVNAVGEVSTVEVSHEALIHAWPRLQEWLREARETMRLQQVISQDASAWKEHKRSTDRLYRGGQLAEALLWRKTTIPNIDEDAFLQASVKEQHRSRRRRIIIGGGVAAGMMGSGLLVYLLRANSTPAQVIITPTPQPISLPYTYKGHTGYVSSVAWAADGKRIASTGHDMTVQVWDTSSGKRLLTYRGHTRVVSSVAWSADDKRIASAGYDETVQVWDAGNGTLLLTYKGHTDQVRSVAWSADGKRIASGSFDKTVQVWDASSGTLLLTYKGHADTVSSVAWSADGKRIASASDDVQVWDASSGILLLTCKGHSSYVNSVAWSIDGKRIASAYVDKTVRVWDASSGMLLLTCEGHTDTVSSVAWSADGKRIASGGYDETVQVYDASSGTLLLAYRGQIGSVYSVAWSADGKCIASGSWDQTVLVWGVGSGTPLFTYKGHTDQVHSVAWSADGKRLASAGYDRTVQVYDASSDTLLLTYKGHTDAVYSVAWSADGERIASASADKTVQVWDASSGTLLLTYKGHIRDVSSVAWSADDKRIASASWDQTVQVWDASSGALLLTYKGHIRDVSSVAWSADDKRIASASGDVQIWDASDGRLLLAYKGHTSYVGGVAWSADDKRIASAGYDQTVQVWDASSGTLLLTYKGHASQVQNVAWSADGKRIGYCILL